MNFEGQIGGRVAGHLAAKFVMAKADRCSMVRRNVVTN